MLPKDSKELLRLFNASGVEYVVVGAFAVAFYGRPRFTGDLDLLIGRNKENARLCLAALHQFGFSSLALSEQDFLQGNFVIQLGVAPNRIDLLTSLTGLADQEAFESAVEGQIDGVPVRFLGRDQLIRNKLATGRPQDESDAAQLGSG